MSTLGTPPISRTSTPVLPSRTSTPTVSPRPSFTSTSSKPLPSLPPTSPTPSVPPTPTAASSRRAALRNFYNLTPTAPPIDTLAPGSFDATAHLAPALTSASPGELLKLENQLVGEIRALDSDRKGLVYDNYKRLIDATETIARIRGGVVGGGGMVVEGLVARVEEALGGMEVRRGVGESGDAGAAGKVVGWVLRAEERVRRLVERGEWGKAEETAKRVEEICAVWGEEEIPKRVRAVLEEAERGRGKEKEEENKAQEQKDGAKEDPSAGEKAGEKPADKTGEVDLS